MQSNNLSETQKIGPYKLLYRLGKGGSSDVYAARGPWNQKLAVKIQRAINKKRQRFLQEFDIPNTFIHPCLNSIYAYGIDADGWSYLVMNQIENAVSVVTYAKKFEGQKRIDISMDLIIKVSQALGELHRKDWIHGDIKSKNILIDKSGQPKLIDFELTRQISATGKGNFFGTRSYAPPEQHEGQKLTPSADVYALAGVLCRMISGELPFPKTEKQEQATFRRNKAPKIPEDISTELKDLLYQALDPTPKNRPANGPEFAKLLLNIRKSTTKEKKES